MESLKMDLKILIRQCEQELYLREYSFSYCQKVRGYWGEFADWVAENGSGSLVSETFHRYCVNTMGSYVLSGIDRRDRLRLRAMRMLMSYWSDGDFEYRTPSVS
jgi:hypothetical protein